MVDIKSVKLKFKNGIEIVPINKQLEKNESYMVYENINYFFSEQSEKQGSAGAIGVFEDSMGKKIQYRYYFAPEGFIGTYRYVLEFAEAVNLKKVETLEMQIDIIENGVITEVNKVLHFDMKYKSHTESMIGSYIRNF